MKADLTGQNTKWDSPGAGGLSAIESPSFSSGHAVQKELFFSTVQK